ncbi:hypothetical protein JZ751_015915, partial [Albula glossodonta]
ASVQKLFREFFELTKLSPVAACTLLPPNLYPNKEALLHRGGKKRRREREGSAEGRVFGACAKPHSSNPQANGHSNIHLLL